MSTFRKRNIQKPIPGTRTSPHTGQIITSSGNPSLDLILGGGLPIGSICLIEEDKFVTHAKVLAKYFLAEGILSLQSVFLGSLDDDPAELLRKLPKPLNDEDLEQEKANEEQNGEAAKNGLRIAWRYNDLPLVNSEQTTTKIGHHFNLMEPMDRVLLRYADTAIWNDTKQNVTEQTVENLDEYVYHFQPEDENNDNEGYTEHKTSNALDDVADDAADDAVDGAADDAADHAADEVQTQYTDLDVKKTQEEDEEEEANATTTSQSSQNACIFENAKYLRLFNEIHSLLGEEKFTTDAMGYKDLCRVCITSLGSPLWYDEHFPKDILKFLTILRAAMRSVASVCFITMPMHLLAKRDNSLVAKIRNLVDYSIELESFAGSVHETNPAYKEYSGLLHMRKITAINTLNAYMPETTDLAFKLRRKKFVIEKLHLPPELQEEQNSKNMTDIVPTLSCGSNAGHNSKASLDF